MPYGYTTKLGIYFLVMFRTSSVMEQDLHINTSKYGVKNYTPSMDVLQEPDDRSHRGYFMGSAANKVVIIYWKPYHPFFHRAHHAWFD